MAGTTRRRGGCVWRRAGWGRATGCRCWGITTWPNRPPRRSPWGMGSCSVPRARATPCSRRARSGGRYSANSWSKCERMTDRRWETRLLALLAAVLVVFGLTAVYGASSLLTTAGGQVGSAFALRQALGALVGGVAATLLARSDYRRGRRPARPGLGGPPVLLVIPPLPVSRRAAPPPHRARPAGGPPGLTRHG